jgi:hypothetical protein
MQLQQDHCNIVISAMLYMAEKYRVIVTIADRFDDGGISDSAATSERHARRLSLTVSHAGITSRDDAERIGIGLAAFSDQMNRQMQKLAQGGMVQDAALLEHNLRKVYEVVPAVEAVAAALGAGAPVAAEADAE